MDRSNAKKWTLVAQGLLGASVLGLGSAAFLNITGSPVAQPPENAELPHIETGASKDAAAPIPRGDDVGTAARLVRVANTPKSAEVPVAVETPVPVTPAPAAGPSISYLGCVHIGSSKRGLIKLDAKQKFVALKQKVGEGEHAKDVEEIEEDYIVIGGQRYERPGRTGSALSQAVAKTNTNPMQALTRVNSTSKVNAVNRQPANPFGAGGPQQDFMIDGFLRLPDYVSREDAELWRRIRAELLESGKFEPEEVGRIAAKQLDTRRETMKEEDLKITPEMRDAERRFQEMYGDIERNKKGKGE